MMIGDGQVSVGEEWQKIERKNVENRGSTKHVDATVRCGKWPLYFRHSSFRYFSFRSFATTSSVGVLFDLIDSQSKLISALLTTYLFKRQTELQFMS